MLSRVAEAAVWLASCLEGENKKIQPVFSILQRFADRGAGWSSILLCASNVYCDA